MPSPTGLLENSHLEAILKAEELSKVDDSDEEPFASKYEARRIWEEILGFLNESVSKQPVNTESETAKDINNVNFDPGVLRCILCMGVRYKLALNCIATNELSEGMRHVDASLDASNLSNEQLTSSLGIATYLSCLNTKAFLLAELEKAQEAKNVLCKSLDLFMDYKHNYLANQDDVSSYPDEFLPIDTNKLFGFALDGDLDLMLKMEGKRKSIVDNFEELYTLALYYMAQVCRNLEQVEEAASYCQSTLERQMLLSGDSGDLDREDWARNCATLSQYYLSRDNFTHARHCLATAQIVAEDVLRDASEGGTVTSEPGDGTPHDRAKQLVADVARCWANYVIVLLDTSKESCCKPEDEVVIEEVKEELPFSEFHLRNPEMIDRRRAVESAVADSIVRSFDAARPLFLKGQSWVAVAKSYYGLNDHCSDHVDVVKDHSRLFKALAFFEADDGRKCKMHKRRQDMLKGLLDELNRDIYLVACRQLLYELGEVSNELLDLKLDAVNATDSADLSDHQLKKINYLVDSAVNYFKEYGETFLGKDAKQPEIYPDGWAKSVVMSHFYQGRLWNKRHTGDPKEKLLYLARSLEHYQWIVDYCARDSECEKVCSAELNLAQDMVRLMPLKMERLKELISPASR